MESESSLSEFEYSLLAAIRDIGSQYRRAGETSVIRQFEGTPQFEGWVTSASVRNALASKSLKTRKALQHLNVDGVLQVMDSDGVQLFRLSGLGERAMRIFEEEGDGIVPRTIRVDSSTWTGIITSAQIYYVLQIVSEIEDIAESIKDNVARSQILGFVTALKVLLELPEPPRKGIVELARDPAFANIIQIGTFLAAIIAAMKA